MTSHLVDFDDALQDVTRGQTKVKRRDYLDSGLLPIIDQGQDFVAGYTNDSTAAFSGPLPVILFGDHTRIVKFVGQPFALGADGVKVLRPSEGFDPEFLAFYLQAAPIGSLGYSRHFKLVKELKFWKPPLDEQRRIVDILNRANAIRRLRHEALDKARQIIPALFIDMFGDPAKPAVPVQRAMLKDVCNIGAGVTKGRKLGDAETIDVPYMRVANVQDGALSLDEIKTIPIRSTELPKYALEPGDLLMTEGGDADKLGRAAIWNGEIESCVHQNHVFRVRCSSETIEPVYLRELVGSSYGKSYFLQVAKRTTGIASINKTQLGQFPVVMPAIGAQREFAARAGNIFTLMKRIGRSIAEHDGLTLSLMAQLFGKSN